MRVHSTDSAAFQNFATATANQIAKRSDVMAKLEDKTPAVAEAINRLANKGKHVPPTMPQPAVAQPVAVAVVARKVTAAPGQIVPAGAPARVLTQIDAAPAGHANGLAHAQASTPNGNAFGHIRDAAGVSAASAATANAPGTVSSAAVPSATLSDGTDQPSTPVASADLGKEALADIGVAPQQPNLQVQLQYATLAKRLLDLAPAATHDAPYGAPRTSDAGAPKPHDANTRRIDVTA